MNDYRFERAARRRRTAALTLTVFLHFLLLAGIAAAGKGNWYDLLPPSLQQYFAPADAGEEAAPPTAEVSKPRP
jgi:hypothetical protein